MNISTSTKSKELSFNLVNEENKSQITVTLKNQKNSLIISAKEDCTPDSKDFTAAFDFFSLCKLHKIFKACETMDEVIEFLSPLINNKEAKIYSTKNEELILEINIVFGVKKEIIKISLHKRNINLEENVFQLNKKIEEMQKEINNLKLAVFGNINIVNEDMNFGQIVKNEEEKKFLINEVEQKLDKKIKGAKLIFSTKIDGDDPSVFHKKCDFKYNTITLIEAKNGRRFGGFANLPWCSADIYKDDKKCFLFSLDYMEVYQYQNDGKGVHSNIDYGPSFGCGHDININKNVLTQETCYVGVGSFNYNGKKSALSGEGEKYIQLKGYEVIEVI